MLFICLTCRFRSLFLLSSNLSKRSCRRSTLSSCLTCSSVIVRANSSANDAWSLVIALDMISCCSDLVTFPWWELVVFAAFWLGSFPHRTVLWLWLWLALAGMAKSPIIVRGGFVAFVIVADDRNDLRGACVDSLLQSCVAFNGRLGAAGALAFIANGRIWVVCADFWLGIFPHWATLFQWLCLATDGGNSKAPIVVGAGFTTVVIVADDQTVHESRT